ncbi:MAG: hypothetical protein GXP45_01090 [bacterium]|nr:hypothetical protein [bacterium]
MDKLGNGETTLDQVQQKKQTPAVSTTNPESKTPNSIENKDTAENTNLPNNSNSDTNN